MKNNKRNCNNFSLTVAVLPNCYPVTIQPYVTGGKAPYTYSFPALGKTDNVGIYPVGYFPVNDVPYEVVIKDSKGCEIKTTVTPSLCNS